MVTEGSLLEGLEEGGRPGGHGAMGHPWAPIPSTQPSGQRVWLGTNTPVWRNTVERVAEIFEKGKHGSRYAINYMYVAMVNQMPYNCYSKNFQRHNGLSNARFILEQNVASASTFALTPVPSQT